MTAHDLFSPLSRRFRRRRMARFLAQAHLPAGTRILDVGGYPGFWAEANLQAHITVLNLHPIEVPESMAHQCVTITGDGTKLQFPDHAFDLVFSNSVIEHLGSWEAQQQFAREVRRVGRQYWVQTPAREFFFEPHLLTPGIHWLSRDRQLKLARHATLWGLLEKPSPARVAEVIAELRLLTGSEMAELFPGGSIIRERFLGLTKSYIALHLA